MPLGQSPFVDNPILDTISNNRNILETRTLRLDTSSCDGSLANQMSWFLFMSTKFDYKTSRFILHGSFGVDIFNV
jgi:hypothetical protein